MFYRRTVILALLQALGGKVDSTDFQRHLFLFCRRQSEPAFDFVPYKDGCYSFSAESDREPMIKKGLLKKENGWSIKPAQDYTKELKAEDRDNLIKHVEQYGTLRGDRLIQMVYRQYPYYAINSENAEELLTGQEMARVREACPDSQNDVLFTIGYEGKSLEAYLNELIQHDLKVLCDVRGNPISRKFGFSKRQLQDAVQKVGIRYVHIPELGIESARRKDLDTPESYQQLFDDFERNVLPHREEYLQQILQLLDTTKRVALTCFEADPARCHRSRVALALSRMPSWKYNVQHI